MPELQCQSCGAPVPIGEPIPRDAECESCRRDLRCCRNCRHWDPRYNNECTESMADPVVDKARRNFCEYFYFNRAPYAAAAGGQRRESDARAKLAGLFKDAPPAVKPPDARARLDALFKKPERAGESRPEGSEDTEE